MIANIDDIKTKLKEKKQNSEDKEEEEEEEEEFDIVNEVALLQNDGVYRREILSTLQNLSNNLSNRINELSKEVDNKEKNE
jgi:hypothetical protein